MLFVGNAEEWEKGLWVGEQRLTIWVWFIELSKTMGSNDTVKKTNELIQRDKHFNLLINFVITISFYFYNNLLKTNSVKFKTISFYV